MSVTKSTFQVFSATFETAFAKCNETSRYEWKKYAFDRFILSVDRIHGNSVNNRIARGGMAHSEAKVNEYQHGLVTRQVR